MSFFSEKILQVMHFSVIFHNIPNVLMQHMGAVDTSITLEIERFIILFMQEPSQCGR